MSQTEKRTQKRIYIIIDVEFDISTHQHWITSSARNFSSGGMCLLTKEYIPMNTLLFIKFHIPESEILIDVTGEVVWHGKHIISDETYFENGIRFIEIKGTYKELIKKYVENSTFKIAE